MSHAETLKGQIVDEETLISLEELCHHCTLQADIVIELVNQGILDPSGSRSKVQDVTEWHFHISSVRRVRTTIHLQRDLGVNLPGAALALDLLDQIAELQKQIN